MTESKYSDSLVIAAGLALLAVVLGYGTQAVTGYLKAAPLGYYVVGFLVPFVLGFVLLQCVKKFKYQFFTFMFVGPFIAVVIYAMFPMALMFNWGESYFLGFLVYAVAGAIIFSFQKVLADWF